jgi:hypothetical protein
MSLTESKPNTYVWRLFCFPLLTFTAKNKANAE